MRRALLGSALLLLLAPATAAASGPPPSTTSSKHGVVALGGGIRYTAQRQGGSTLVKRLAEPRGRVQRAVTLPGRWGVPAVAIDGSASGLSADGRTLVLAAAVNDITSVHRTHLLVLDAATLRVRQRVDLRGAFGFDAISPDGRTLYLIGYRSTGNPTDYAVRAYDVGARHLLSKPIVDPREPDEKMTGIPVTRAYSQDGAWAYTLYAGDKPFVHALDTRGRTARCIDVPASVVSGDIGAINLRISRGGGRLYIADGPTPVVIVDTRTFKISTPPIEPRVPQPVPPAPSPKPAAAADGGGSSFPWALLGGIAAALALAAAAVTIAARRYAGSASPE